MTEVTHREQYDEEHDRLIIYSEQDVAPFLKRNRERYANRRRKEHHKSETMNHYAEIPMIIAYKWLVEFGIDIMNEDHAPAVERLLNDPEWKYLRTRPGRM